MSALKKIAATETAKLSNSFSFSLPQLQQTQRNEEKEIIFIEIA
jgi:hypothetical protein